VRLFGSLFVQSRPDCAVSCLVSDSKNLKKLIRVQFVGNRDSSMLVVLLDSDMSLCGEFLSGFPAFTKAILFTRFLYVVENGRPLAYFYD
jgi:hypothetical protein